MPAKKYPKSLIVIHWLTLLLLIIVFLVGLSFDDYKFNEENMNRYRLHAILGMTILILTLIRIYIRRKNLDRLPPHITYYSKSHRIFVQLVISLMYVFLIFTPFVGFIMVYQTGALSYDLGGPFPVGAEFDENLEAVHKMAVFTLLALVVIHVAGVVMYKIKTGNNLLTRMMPF